MNINFKFLPTFLGALALTLALDAPAKRSAPVRAAAVPAAAAAPRSDAFVPIEDGVRPVNARPVSLASNRVAGPQAPARPAPADPDDW